MVKYYAAEMAERVTSEALQIWVGRATPHITRRAILANARLFRFLKARQRFSSALSLTICWASQKTNKPSIRGQKLMRVMTLQARWLSITEGEILSGSVRCGACSREPRYVA